MTDEEITTRIEDAVERAAQRAGEESRRHFDVVAERLEDRMDLMIEGVLNNSERIGRVDSRVDDHEERIQHLEVRKR